MRPMKLFVVLVALCFAGTLPGVQSCCNARWTGGIGNGDNGQVSFQRDLHFDRVPEVLSPAQRSAFLACQRAWYDKAVAHYGADAVDDKYPVWVPDTNPGSCNMFGCNCDHCYGAENCQGTNDGYTGYKDQAPRWTLYAGDDINHRAYTDIYQDCPEPLRDLVVPGYSGVCARGAGGSAGGPSSAAPPPADAAARACADKDKVLNSTLPQLAATLSSLYCETSEGGSGVGLEFAGSLLASLDADKSGSVDCAEWGIAKQTTALHQLAGGGYFGPAKLEPPLCKLSAAGKDQLARYNAYLGRLTLGTLAANTTAAVASAASRAAVTAENGVVAGPAAGALLAARDKVAAAWNATASRSG